MRIISQDEAGQAYDVLVRLAGAVDDKWERQAFVHSVSVADRPTTEYRFGGRLGSGGKFRNNGNRDDVPYVDCYREDMNAAREAIIAATNDALAAIFRPELDRAPVKA